MCKLSIIVPAVGPQSSLDDTLVAVLENRPDPCQIVVPHPRGYQDPYELSDEIDFVACESADLSALINAGVEASQANIVHILLSGTRVHSGWTNAAVARLEHEPELAAVSPALLEPHNPRRLLAAGVCIGRAGRKILVGRRQRISNSTTPSFRVDGPPLQAAFLRRTVLQRIDGLRNQFGPYHIDTDLAARLRQIGAECAYEPSSQVTGYWQDRPRGFRSAWRAEQLYWCHAADLTRRGRFSSHLAYALGDVARQLPYPSAALAGLGRTVGLLMAVCGYRAARSLPTPKLNDRPMTIPIDQPHIDGAPRRAA